LAEAPQDREPGVIAGHFGFAAAVKSREPRAPLWALMLATVWLDIVFVPLFVAGIESTELVDKAHPGYGENIIHADYTHSLVGMIVLSAILGGLAALLWGRRTGVVIGLVAASHWVLDLFVHRADMPILPGNIGNLPRLGLGLWSYPTASAGIELALVLAGAWLYWRTSSRVARVEGSGARAAAISAALIAVFGIATLWMDFTAA
jgi:membrane-bound metal-dependent hydrolase YbcI (DUF457 family)